MIETREPLVDSHGREHTELRLSLTNMCNFRCNYCMTEDHKPQGRQLELTTPELVRVAGVAHSLGISGLRLTGGEPLLRRDAVDVVQQLSEIGFDDLAMTTNGSMLLRDHGGVSTAEALKNAGLERINVSCDSLDPENFERIRRRGKLATVMAGLEEAQRVGFDPIKMNVVVIRDQNDHEILDFANYARESHKLGRAVVVRFIEFMPLGETGEKQASWTPEKVVSSQEVLETIQAEWPLEIASRQGDSAPAARWAFADGQGEIGVVPTMTNPFCGDCNRLRVTADGFVMPCLFSPPQDKLSLRNLMRTHPEYSDEEMDEAIAAVFRKAVHSKQPGQNRKIPDIFENPGAYLKGSQVAQLRTMSSIGG